MNTLTSLQDGERTDPDRGDVVHGVYVASRTFPETTMAFLNTLFHGLAFRCLGAFQPST